MDEYQGWNIENYGYGINGYYGDGDGIGHSDDWYNWFDGYGCGLSDFCSGNGNGFGHDHRFVSFNGDAENYFKNIREYK